MTKTVAILDECLERGANACECPNCGGFAACADEGPTKAEIKEHQTCGRPWACCIAAFVCKKCKQRIIAHLNAPEMD